MNINKVPYRTIWESRKNSGTIEIIDQRLLPFEFRIAELKEPNDFIFAINEMQVRGAPLIGVAAAYAMYCYAVHSPEEGFTPIMNEAAARLNCTRPTAVNLSWAVKGSLEAMARFDDVGEKRKAALDYARKTAEEDVENCRKIGEYGCELIRAVSRRKNGATVNILTHCNAGWLATVDYGTATAPIYSAFDKGIGLHVWVDETRPRNQGARLTAWELTNHGVDNTIIVDNAGGHLMQNGMVDLVIVGSDRTALNGDVANKTGTYLKALAARDNDIPFYVALPVSSIDATIAEGKDIAIEQRHEDEVLYTEGYLDNRLVKARTAPFGTRAANWGFDVTPSRLVSGLITEKGIINADKENIEILFLNKYYRK